MLAGSFCCEDACRFVVDLGPEWRGLIQHLLFCPGCWMLVAGRVDSGGPDQRAQRIEGVLAAEGLMADLLAREPSERLALLDSEPGFLTGAFLCLVSCAASDDDSTEPVSSVAAWACQELERIGKDRNHALNRRVKHGFVLDLLKHLTAGNRLAYDLSRKRDALAAGNPKVQPLLRMEEEALLWSRQIQGLAGRLAIGLLPPRPWHYRFREGADGEIPASPAETGIALSRWARAPQEWMALLCHVMGCASCRIRLSFVKPAPWRGPKADAAGGEPTGARGETALADLSFLRKALVEGLGACTDRRQERAFLWALEDLVLLTTGKASPLPSGGDDPASMRRRPSSQDSEPELQALGEHVAGCRVCQEETRRSTPSDFGEAEELYAILRSQPWSWDKAVEADGRAWAPAFGRLLACELARSPLSRSQQAWLKDIQGRRLEALIDGVAAGGPSPAYPRPALDTAALRSLLDMPRQLADIQQLRGLCCDLAQRLPVVSVELYETHRDLLRVERRLEWVLSFLLDRSGPPLACLPEGAVVVESHVGRVARASAAWRHRLSQVEPSDRLKGGGWGLSRAKDLRSPDPVEWVELMGDSSRHLRVLHDVSAALERCSIAVVDPWQAELLGYLHRDLEEVDRRTGETFRALASERVQGRRSRRANRKGPRPLDRLALREAPPSQPKQTP